MNLTTTVEGRARYPVNIRYPRELRDDVEKLKRILVPAMTAARVGGTPPSSMTATNGILQVPLGELADFRIVRGPTAIKSEEGLTASYVYIDISDRDVGSYVEDARKKKRRRSNCRKDSVWSGAVNTSIYLRRTIV
jgi:Cu(I)/Ag(I) efflux system membrane protein CusA/SilA